MYQSDEEEEKEDEGNGGYYYDKDYESDEYEQQEAISIIDDNMDIYSSPVGKKSVEQSMEKRKLEMKL